MAEENENGQEKTEEPTDERREEFRKKGEVAYSREITSVLVLATVGFFLSLFATFLFKQMREYMIHTFQNINYKPMSSVGVVSYLSHEWRFFITLITPVFLCTGFVAISVSLAQTKFNISFEKIKPNKSWLLLLRVSLMKHLT